MISSRINRSVDIYIVLQNRKNTAIHRFCKFVVCTFILKRLRPAMNTIIIISILVLLLTILFRIYGSPLCQNQSVMTGLDHKR